MMNERDARLQYIIVILCLAGLVVGIVGHVVFTLLKQV